MVSRRYRGIFGLWYLLTKVVSQGGGGILGAGGPGLAAAGLQLAAVYCCACALASWPWASRRRASITDGHKAAALASNSASVMLA